MMNVIKKIGVFMMLSGWALFVFGITCFILLT